MVDYQKMYSTLFNAITDAIDELQQNNYCKAITTLILAQQETEEMYINADENENA